MRFVSKPTTVEAVQWNDTPESTAECVAFLETIPHGLDIGLDIADSGHASANALFYCAKSNTRVHIVPGDWIIAEPDGTGFYPCAADIFEARWQRTSSPDECYECGRVVTAGTGERQGRAGLVHFGCLNPDPISLDSGDNP